MIFASDNWAGAHPAIGEALARHAGGFAAAYGTSDLDRKIEERFNTLFEREVAVFFVGTGTAANSLALASVNRPGGVSFCHSEAHVIEDECGAPEFFTNGARLVPIDGAAGRMDTDALEAEVARFAPGVVHTGQPMAITMTQPTEVGTVYAPEDIERIAGIAKRYGLPLHMDGARFANALVHLGLSPAEMTWKRGVDIVSFGGTKNGCWCAEALVFMNPEMARDVPFIRKRAAQLFSKSRFVAAQFDAYFEDDLWLDLARHSNAMADRLRAGIAASDHARLGWETQTNELFPIIEKARVDSLRTAGAVVMDWMPPRAVRSEIGEDEMMARMVTSFASSEGDVDRLLESLG
ncbi:threonine aldolase family protein [Pararhizobium mangrovi]|uniref:L-threonine aldolase n=1 Tax=Pararhizobium mangrovi TaxID=2590452 RepID=A0A506U6D2_9HYPH|nr:low specificity L-threonine aldolase [Pararhizobium mangrovi]TPW29952.1 low specificity L-threonine aldolase [Pararhizobium mangrovi]